MILFHPQSRSATAIVSATFLREANCASLTGGDHVIAASLPTLCAFLPNDLRLPANTEQNDGARSLQRIEYVLSPWGRDIQSPLAPHTMEFHINHLLKMRAFF